jgi:hypothetical protein
VTRIAARFPGDERAFWLIFIPSVPDGEKLDIARGWGESHFWASAVVNQGVRYERVVVDVGKAYVLEPDENGRDPVEMIGPVRRREPHLDPLAGREVFVPSPPRAAPPR